MKIAHRFFPAQKDRALLRFAHFASDFRRERIGTVGRTACRHVGVFAAVVKSRRRFPMRHIVELRDKRSSLFGRNFTFERVERFTVRPRYERNVIHAFHPPFDFYRVDTRVFHIRKLIDHIEIFTRKDCGKIIAFKNRKIFTCSFFFRKPQYTR